MSNVVKEAEEWLRPVSTRQGLQTKLIRELVVEIRRLRK